MTIREAISEQRKAMKDRSLKEKLSYYWEYYGIKAICLTLALVLLIVFIVSIATKKDYAFAGVFFGAAVQEGAESYLSDFSQATGIDPEKYEISVQCHLDIQIDQPITQEIYTSMQTFSAMVAAKSVDCFAGNIDLFLYYAYMEYALDLRTVLTPQELEQLSPYLHYIDGKLIEEQENDNEGLTSAYSQRPDSTKPELMTDPIPVAVDLTSATAAFSESYHFDSEAVIGICSSASSPQNALAFLRYCFDLS